MKTNGILAALAACALALLAAGCNNGFTDAALNAMKNNAEQTVPVEGITLNTYRLTLKPGTSTSAPLEATVTPKNATDKKVKWSSSNTKIATVSDNGTVTAVALGTATITAKAGDKETTCTVTVKDILVPVTNVWLNSSWLTLVRGATGQLTAEVQPGNADIKAVTWESKNPDIATVDENGTVTAVAVGETTITVTTEEGNHTATCEVTVNPKPVERITLSEKELSLMVGKTRQLTATWEPEDADVTSVEWKSSDMAVATVGEDGTVTAEMKGEATVTATIRWGDGDEERTTAECAVTVTLPDVEAEFILNEKGYLIKYDGTDTNVVIPEGVTGIGGGVFYGNTDIKGVTILDSVTSIGNRYDFYGVFQGCSNLISVTIGDKVERIGKNAFKGCTNLVNVTIPGSVTSIGESAFEGCSGLISVDIPASVTSFGSGAFQDCEKLNTVNYGGTLAQWCTMNNNGYHIVKAEIVNVDGTNLKAMTSLVIPEGVTSIGISAFHNCTKLVSVEIPEGVKSIGNSAFNGCTSLTDVTIPDGVTSIGDGAFYGCTGLTEVVIPDSVESLGSSNDWYGVFKSCTSLTSVTIGKGVTSIGYYAFCECTSLETITYTGTQEEWKDITIDSDSGLSGKTITGKDADGNEVQWTAQ